MRGDRGVYMDILMMVLAAFSFLSLIFFSVKSKEFYQSELSNADSGSIIGEIIMYVIHLFPWYIRKLFLILISLALCMLCVGYYIFE
jgi:hypothetical protein